MGAKYAGFVVATNTASTTDPMFNLTGGTSKRVRLYHLIIGSPATPGNQAGRFAVRRASAAGTPNASFTPTALDPADPACSAAFSTGWAVMPTITANSDMLHPSLNQQSTFQWMVDPDRGAIVIPATSGAGLPLMAVATTSAASHSFNAFFQE
jgi:hypothetical protein